MPFFPYDTVSSFFDAEGGFQEDLEVLDLLAIEDDPHPCCRHCHHGGDKDTHLAACCECEEGRGLFVRAEAQAEDEQAHWEGDPEYRALYNG